MHALDPILYPAIEPYQADYLAVSSLHHLYFEQCGNSQRLPVLFVHGGPGGGWEPMHRRYFDPSTYRIILFDQRGAGRSRPQAELIDNTTPHLIADIEQPDFALAFARIECHYFTHDSFLEPDQLLRDGPHIRDLPGVIIQGRYDIVCPARSAWDLHRAWPEAEFHVVPDTGHSATEAGIASKLIEATNTFQDQLRHG
jgi:pimeloyl-ACP methyl ester carboxylesterase